MTREQARQILIRNNRREMARVQGLLADQAAYIERHPEVEFDINDDGILSLIVAWLDQQYRELLDDVFPLSDPPPRLKEFLESNA
jgi:hypothetical protein